MMDSRGRLRRVAGAATLAAAAVVLASGVSSAAAANPDVLLSIDGVRFAPTLDTGMFDSTGTLVPGAAVTSSLWVKNPAARPVALRVSMRDVVVSSADYASGLVVSAWDSGTGSTYAVPLEETNSCEVLVPAQRLAAGKTVKMDISIALGDLSGQAAQAESAEMDFIVSIRDDEPGAFPASACEDSGAVVAESGAQRNSIASTGGDFPAPLLLTGGLLFGLGMFLIAGPRRTRTDES